MVVNAVLFCAYFWSWDESHTITIRVTTGGASASVDGDRVDLLQPITDGQIGLQIPPYSTYRIQATGELVQSDTSSPLGRLAQALRLAQPRPAWSGFAVSTARSSSFAAVRALSTLIAGAPGLRLNSRDEWAGPAGAIGLTPRLWKPPYTIRVQAVRPEGAARVLVDIGRGGTGYALQVRLDQPDLLWAQWANGDVNKIVGAAAVQHMDAIAEIQRVLRTVLPGFLFGALFSLCVLGAYPILLGVFNGFRPREPDSLESLRLQLASTRFAIGFSLLVGVIALLATGTVSTVLLDRMPHVQDSVAYLFQAKIFAGGHLSAHAPPAALQPFFLEEYMPFFGDKWFSQYPPGHPLMLTLGVLLHASWLVEPVLASLSLIGVYLIGRTVYGSLTGALAAVIGLLSPFWLFLGSEFMAHPTGLFFGTVCFLSVARAERGGGRRWVLLLGFAAGMLALTRQVTAIGLLAPLAIYAAIFSRKGIRFYLPSILSLCIPVIGLLLYNWIQLGDPFQSTYAAWSSHYKLGFGPDASPGGAFTPADGIWNAYQNLSMLTAHLYGWPFGTALALMFVPFLVGAARRWDFLLLASFVTIVVIHMFYWCACLMYGPRFYYEALPSLLLLTARGAYELFRLPLRVWPRFGLVLDESTSAFAPVVLLTALAIFNLRFYMPAQWVLYKDYNYSSDAELATVHHAGIHNAVVFVVSNPPGFWSSYGNVFFANDPSLRGDVVYAHDLGGQDRQLFPAFPGRRYYRLNGSTLTAIH